MRRMLMTLFVVAVLFMAANAFADNCGDVNNSGTINALDITYLINYLYKHGPAPNCGISYLGVCGDVNRSGTVNALDITYLINYLYKHGPAPDCSYSTPSTTTIIPPTDSTTILNYDTTIGSVFLDESSAYAQNVAVGDVIIGQDNQVAPDGFLRKVTSKTTQGGAIVLETQQATMSEAFESMDISETHQLMPSAVKSFKLYNGSKFVPDKAGETFTVQLDCILYDQDGDPSTTNDQIKLDGQFAFTAALFTNIKMSWFQLKKFEAGIAAHQDVNLDLIASMQWQFANEAKFDLAEFHFGAIPVGGLVWLVPTLTVEAHIQGDLTVSVETGITYTQQLRYGLGYANNAYYDISESTKDFTYTPPQFTAEFNFEPGASLNASCLLYGIAGPYMAGKAGFHFQSVLNAAPCIVDLTFDLNAILYAVVGIQCDIIGLDYNKEYQLYTYPIGEWMYHLGGCGTITDIDGNTYQTVKIGNQWWMAENLKSTHYRNGDPIPNVTDGATWEGLTTGAYCEYNNDINNVAIYGRLYNWYAVNDSRNIAPEGWHVASDSEWKQLEIYLGMSQTMADSDGWRGTVEGGKLKESGTAHWLSPNTGANNESGFSGLPSGYRQYDGVYQNIGLNDFFWTSTFYNISYAARSRALIWSESRINRNYFSRDWGFSVRCVKD